MTLESQLNYVKRFSLVKYFYTNIALTVLCKITILKNFLNYLANKLPRYEVEGVSHADDLTYLFPSFFAADVTKGSEEDLYIRRFVKLWTNFAKFGNPTPEADETLNNTIWKPVSKERFDEYFVIDKEMKMENNMEKDRVEFWEKIFKQYSP